MESDLITAAFEAFMDEEFPGWREVAAFMDDEFPGWREAGADWRADMQLAFRAGRASVAGNGQGGA